MEKHSNTMLKPLFHHAASSAPVKHVSDILVFKFILVRVVKTARFFLTG